jgi:hypothetical protein
VFENAKEAAVFWDHFGLGLSIFSTEVVLCTELLHNPSHQKPLCRAVSVTEMKRTCSVGEVSVEISDVCVHLYVQFIQLLYRVLEGFRDSSQ